MCSKDIFGKFLKICSKMDMDEFGSTFSATVPATVYCLINEWAVKPYLYESSGLNYKVFLILSTYRQSWETLIFHDPPLIVDSFRWPLPYLVRMSSVYTKDEMFSGSSINYFVITGEWFVGKVLYLVLFVYQLYRSSLYHWITMNHTTKPTLISWCHTVVSYLLWQVIITLEWKSNI